MRTAHAGDRRAGAAKTRAADCGVNISHLGAKRQNRLLDADGEKRPEWRTNGEKAEDEIIMMRKNKMKSCNKYIPAVKSTVFPAPPVLNPQYKTQIMAVFFPG